MGIPTYILGTDFRISDRVAQHDEALTQPSASPSTVIYRSIALPCHEQFF